MRTTATSPTASTATRLLGVVVGAATVAPLLRQLIARHAVPAGTGRRISFGSCGTRWHSWPLLPGVTSPLGRCSTCRQPVGAAKAFTVEVTLIVTLAVLLTSNLQPLEIVAVGWWAVCWIILAFVDLQVHRLPDSLTAAAAAGCLILLAAAAWWQHDWAAWSRALAAGITCALVFALSALLLGSRGFGLGDAKGAVSAGAILGWFGWPVVLAGMFLSLLAASMYGLILLAVGRISRTGHLPFGPFLAVGTLATVVLSV